MTAHRPIKRVIAAIIGILTVTAAITGCSQGSPKAASTPRTSQVKTLAFDLYTHCGINELKAFGRYFQHAGGPLDDGSGNPPKGWGNPYQPGTLQVSGDTAVFRDTLGHVERFKAEKAPDMSVARCS